MIFCGNKTLNFTIFFSPFSAVDAELKLAHDCIMSISNDTVLNSQSRSTHLIYHFIFMRIFFYNYFMRYLYFSFDAVIRNRTSARYLSFKVNPNKTSIFYNL